MVLTAVTHSLVIGRKVRNEDPTADTSMVTRPPHHTYTILVASMERLYMETQVGLKRTALTLFLNLFFHFLPAAALCDDFSLVDSVKT